MLNDVYSAVDNHRPPNKMTTESHSVLFWDPMLFTIIYIAHQPVDKLIQHQLGAISDDDSPWFAPELIIANRFNMEQRLSESRSCNAYRTRRHGSSPVSVDLKMSSRFWPNSTGYR